MLSALGGLVADIKNDFVKITLQILNEETLPAIEQDFQQLEQKARNWLIDENADPHGASFIFSAEMRYKGQSFEIETRLAAEDIQQRRLAAIRQAFHDEHQRLYGYCDKQATIQIVSLRLVASREVSKPVLQPLERRDGAPQPLRLIDVWMDDGFLNVPLYQRSQLLPASD